MKTDALARYIERLPITQGEGLGKPFTILPWQKRFLRGLASTDGDCALSVARGNGKTGFLAAIALAHLDGPLAVERSEIIFVASSFQQARIGFNHARAFLEARGEDLKDRAKWRLHDNYQVAGIEHIPNRARLRVLGCDPRRAHGLAPRLVVCDEPAQFEFSKSERMISALRTGLGKVPGSRLIAIGTRPASSDHWFAAMLRDAEYSQVHAAPDGAPAFSRRTWAKANPSMKFFPELAKRIEKESRDAKRDPRRAAEFRSLRLNLGTSDTLEAFLLEPETWERLSALGDAPMNGPWALGLDLGTNAAMCAAAGYWPETGALRTMALFPTEPNLRVRGVADGVDEIYLRMAERGELFTAGGRAADVAALLRRVADDWGMPSVISLDRWREAEARDALDRAKFPHVPIEVRGQGFRDGAADVRAFREAVLSDDVRPGESLLLTFAMSAARVVSDPAGNSKLAKGVEGGRRSRSRDDAAAAAILAVAAGRRAASSPARAPRSFVA